jgi:hypothetical protein
MGAPRWRGSADLRRPHLVLARMFFFFSNRLGCLGSLLISAAITLGLLVLLGWIDLGGW